jgi:hypothetical protein
VIAARALERLTRRELPDVDPEIEKLDPEVRALVGGIWADRARSELGAGSGFAIVVTELYALGADATVLRLATKAAYDEVRHAELCRVLAEAYLGRPIEPPRAKRVGMPKHQADETLEMHLHVVGLSCINETLAAGFVEACLETAEAPLVRTIQREHLMDEVEHARVGWAHLASPIVDDETKRRIGAFVPRLVKANVSLWRSRIAELPEHGVPGHGYPTRARMLRAIDETMTTVVLPGFAHVGVPLTAARGRA